MLSKTNIQSNKFGSITAGGVGNSESNLSQIVKGTDIYKVRFHQHVVSQFGLYGGLYLRPWIHEPYVTKLNKKNTHDFELYLVQGLRAHSDSIWVARFSPDG